MKSGDSPIVLDRWRDHTMQFVDILMRHGISARPPEHRQTVAHVLIEP